MKKFSQFQIKPIVTKGFEGDKIRIIKILNKEIVVHDFKIEDSKVFKEHGTGKCLSLQISINNQKHIVFTGSGGLIDNIMQVPKEEFPFMATIVEENDRYLFT